MSSLETETVKTADLHYSQYQKFSKNLSDAVIDCAKKGCVHCAQKVMENEPK